MVKNKVPASKKRGVPVIVKNTSRTLSFLNKARDTLASAVTLEVEVITGLIKGEVREKFAHAILEMITKIIQSILRS